MGAGRDPANRESYMDYGTPAVGVYALDLLEQAQPGLRENLRQSITDEGAFQRFRDGVNGIRPGLFEDMTSVENYDITFTHALRLVVEALGLTDAPPR